MGFFSRKQDVDDRTHAEKVFEGANAQHGRALRKAETARRSGDSNARHDALREASRHGERMGRVRQQVIDDRTEREARTGRRDHS